ncbi:MAG: UDP-glucose 4-epimerase GalE [Lachnospiraceae bacterium]|nr:UDP-glucose 4-epimerase GalE [Lachnospiraceae bacterium]
MILVVGGAGYIGSHTNKELNRRGYQTLIYDNLVYGHKESVKWGKLEVGDLAEEEHLERIFQENSIDAVLHFAAYAYVGESVAKPAKYYKNNVCNTIQLLDIMRKYQVNHIIFSSTCATYGVPDKMPITEDMPQKPVNPYGATKWMVERILEDYRKAYGINYCCLRYFNAAGADPEGELGESHMPETHLIPLILDAASGKRESISIFGTDYPTKDGTCIRDYIHVSDLADAHIRALEYLKQGGESTCFNLGNGNGDSVRHVIEVVKQVTGKEFKVKEEKRRAGDPPVLIGSAEKAEKVLGWKPKYAEIETIVEHAWKWHENKEY